MCGPIICNPLNHFCRPEDVKYRFFGTQFADRKLIQKSKMFESLPKLKNETFEQGLILKYLEITVDTPFCVHYKFVFDKQYQLGLPKSHLQISPNI